MNLFHIVDRDVWAAAVAHGSYAPESLKTEGFVHFSHAHQVRGTYQAIYADVPNLIVVEIDPQRVDAELRTEDSYGSGTEFPHIYGEIPTDAAVATHELDEFTSSGLSTPDR